MATWSACSRRTSNNTSGLVRHADEDLDALIAGPREAVDLHVEAVAPRRAQCEALRVALGPITAPGADAPRVTGIRGVLAEALDMAAIAAGDEGCERQGEQRAEQSDVV
jgi:hypothetical protein